jgi:hypothetical protein
MTTDEVRQHVSNHLLGLGLALGLLVDGMRHNIEPEVVSDEQNVELNVIFTMLNATAARAVALAQEIKGDD